MIPESVRRAAELADKAIADSQNPQPTPVDPGTPAPVQDVPPAQPTPTNPTSAEVIPLPGEGMQPPVPATLEPQPAPAPAVDYEHKFRVLQGKYNKEVQEVRQAQAQDSQRLATQDQTIAQLQQEIAELRKATPDPVVAQIREDFGDELATPFEQILTEKNQLNSKVQTLETQLAQFQQGNEQVMYEQRKSALSAQLQQVGIPFEQVNADPQFHAWLKEPDLMSGIKRQQLLDSAFGSGDIARTVAMFQAFTQSRPVQPTNFQQHARIEQGYQQPAQPGQAPVAWSEQQINELYRRAQSGEIAPEEFQRLERELFASMKR